MIGNLDSSSGTAATRHGHNDVNARSKVLYSSCASRYNVVVNDEGVHYDHDRSDDEPSGNVDHQFPPYVPSSAPIIGYERLSLACQTLFLHMGLGSLELIQS